MGWGLIGGAVAEHGVQDVATAAGQADQGGVVALVLIAFALVVGGADSDVNAAVKMARLRCLLPPLGGRSPRMEVPEIWLTGVSPASAAMPGGREGRAVADL